MRLILCVLFTTLFGFSKTIEITQKATNRTLSVKVVDVTDKEVIFTTNKKEFTLPLDDLTDESVSKLQALDLSDLGLATTVFGIPVEGKRICYIVDLSASMSGSRHTLTKKELQKSFAQLDENTDFALLCFAGPTWQLGDETKIAEDRKSGYVIGENGKKYKWSGEESQNWEAKGTKQEMTWFTSSEENIKKAQDYLDKKELIYGTSWTAPLDIAIKMEPDVIIFMTDGSSGDESVSIAEKASKKAKADSITIHSVSINEPKVKDALQILSKNTGGISMIVLDEEKALNLETQTEVKY